ncbi:hypothetical protein ACOMHN_035755 [Nucella lapillus]
MNGSDSNTNGIPKSNQNFTHNQHVGEQNGSSDGNDEHQTPDSTLLLDKSAAEAKSGCSEDAEENVDNVIEVEFVKEKRLFYKVSETPPLRLVLLFSLQQGLLPVSGALAVSALVAEVACGRDDGAFRTTLLSSTFLMIGLSTFTMSTFGIRLPIFQGPASTYIIPLLALMNMDEWKCPTQQELATYYGNDTMNSTDTGEPLSPPKNYIYGRMRQLSGSLMVAGGLHCAIGFTGLVGFMLKFIGPVTIVPAITLVGLYIYKITVKFCETNWTVSLIVAACGVIFSMYLGKRSTPIPAWSRERGFHLKWFPLHQVFAILISIIIGWTLSAIYTHFNWLSKDRNSVEYYARTDTQLHIIHNTAWLSFPYPGQYGAPVFHAGVFLSFFLATLLSVLDSIGDYNACARMCYVPRPPEWAVNRGIAVEGVMSLLSGILGTGQATVSYGGNIGAIGLTKVASRRIFQVVGGMYVLLAVVSKIGAVFITVPYSVLGGTQILTVGIFIGIVLSNLQYVDLTATRNVAIIGIALLLGLIVPYWVTLRPHGINTGNEEANRMISILLANPVFVGGFLACILDNTIPGTLKERGIILENQIKKKKAKTSDDKAIPVNQDDVNDNGNDDDDDDNADSFEEGIEVYHLPWLPDSIQRSSLAKFVRIFPGKGQMRRGFTGTMNM